MCSFTKYFSCCFIALPMANTFFGQYFLQPKKIFCQNFFWPIFFLAKFFFSQIFFRLIFFRPIFFSANFFFQKNPFFFCWIFTFSNVFAYSSTRILWFYLKTNFEIRMRQKLLNAKWAFFSFTTQDNMCVNRVF
jgi:hypothetical protein